MPSGYLSAAGHKNANICVIYIGKFSLCFRSSYRLRQLISVTLLRSQEIKELFGDIIVFIEFLIPTGTELSQHFFGYKMFIKCFIMQR